MPSKRKRIGFLPRSEVQEIIDQVCKHNKLSQSKVTGILVEEALSSRGVLDCAIMKLSFDFDCYNSNSSFGANDNFHNETSNEDNIQNIDENFIKNEVEMINEFIEFKFFKSIMKKNKRKNK